MPKNEEAKYQDTLKKMTDEEIGVEIASARDRFFTLRSKAVTEKVENSSQFGVAKRNIARLLTEQNARRIKGSGAARTPAAAPKKAAAPKAKKAPAKAPARAVAKKAAPSGAATSKSRPSARTKSSKTAKASK